VVAGLGVLALRNRSRRAPNASTGADDADKPDDSVFFPLGDGDWLGFPSGETLDTEDLPYEGQDPSVPIASGVTLPIASPFHECVARPWEYPPGFCKCIVAGGSEQGCMQYFSSSGDPSWATGCCGGGAVGQFMEATVSREEAFDAASRLTSMYPNIRTIVAQAPDGFYVRVITAAGANIFDRGGRSGWGGVLRAIDRLPSQIGRVRVQIDRLVSPDFAVGATAWDVSIDEARDAQETLRSDLIARCKCVLGWMRGVGLNGFGPSVELLVDGSKMSDEARQMVPPSVGRVPVQIRDIGDGPVPFNMEIVAP